MNKDDEHKQFSEWLASRMDDAELSAEDKKVFADWIMTEQHPEHPEQTSHEKKEPDTHITVKEVKELFVWLKNRITGSSLNSKDRKLFNDWLVQRVTDHPTVDRDEFHKIKRDLLDD